MVPSILSSNSRSRVLVGVVVCLTGTAAVSCGDPYEQSAKGDGAVSTLIVVESTTVPVEPLALPVQFLLKGGLTVRVSLPKGFEETPLARGTIESPDGSITTTQSYGLPPTYEQSIIVSVSTGSRVKEQLVFNPETSLQTLDAIRSVPVYSWHDSDSGQDGMAFAPDATTVIWIFTRNVSTDVVVAIAAVLEVLP